jgi:DNA-damage-inducible protein J
MKTDVYQTCRNPPRRRLAILIRCRGSASNPARRNAGFLTLWPFVATIGYEGVFDMATDTVVRARIDEHVKEEATSVLDKMGLTVSDAIRMLLIRVAREKALPFDVRIPNAETAAAIEEARQGKLKSFNSVEELMKDLNEDDSADESL